MLHLKYKIEGLGEGEGEIYPGFSKDREELRTPLEHVYASEHDVNTNCVTSNNPNFSPASPGLMPDLPWTDQLDKLRLVSCIGGIEKYIDFIHKKIDCIVLNSDALNYAKRQVLLERFIECPYNPTQLGSCRRV